MTMLEYSEFVPQPQAQGQQPPPAPPKRTAVATDEPEKRPCRYCGHTQADHMGPVCRGGQFNLNDPSQLTGVSGASTTVASPSYPGATMTWTGPRSACLCRTYSPKVD